MGSRSRRRARKQGLPKRTTARDRAAPPSSGRYTPPAKYLRIRPTWHRVVGAIEAVLGALLIMVNYVQDEQPILPGGHSELYFIAGLAIAAGSLWWFGAFDRLH